MQAALRPLQPQHLGLLERPIEGTVSYVDQVNALRIALHKYAQSVRSEVEGLRSSLEQSLGMLSRVDMKYDDLVAYIQAVQTQRDQLSTANQAVADFELPIKIRRPGSGLSIKVRICSPVSARWGASQGWAEEFDHLSREIAEISTVAATSSISCRTIASTRTA